MAALSDASVRTSGVTDLLDDRLVFVTGKGGTGKTAVAAALAVVLAAKGRRVLLCEVDAQRPALAPIFGVEPTYKPVKVSERLDVCNLVWPDVLGAWLRRVVRIGRLVDAILGNDLVRRFLDFTPGAQDLVELSAIDDFVGAYDVVIVDMPASGHAFSLLDITRSALRLFRAGPVRQRAEELRARIEDPQTRVVLVALPEEMVVNETLETLDRLRDGRLVGGAPLVVVNRCLTTSMPADQSALLDRLSVHAELALVRAGAWERGLEVASAEAIQRLHDRLGRAPVALGPVSHEGGARRVVGDLARQLAPSLGVAATEVRWT